MTMCDENFISQEELSRETELIFRGAAFQVIADNCRTDQMTLKCYDKLLEGISNIPAVDEEPIRCRYCKCSNKVDEHEYWCFAWGPAQLVPPDGWCFRAKKKQEGNQDYG